MTLTDVWTVAIGFGTLVLTIAIIGLMIKSSNDTAHTRIEGNINKVEKNVNDNSTSTASTTTSTDCSWNLGR